MEIADRTAVVTGASSGIGRATANALADAGATVALLARDEAALESVAETIEREGGTAGVYPVDLADPSAIAETTTAVQSDGGDPSILVNNAGVGGWVSVPETAPREAESMVTVPYLAAFRLTRAFLPAMLERDAGHVVNVSSPAPWATVPGATAYNASRFAVHGFTRALRLDLRTTGVGVTEAVPYHVDGTGYVERNANVRERTPGIGRLVRHVDVETVADAIVTGVRRERRLVVEPPELRLVMGVARLAPRLMDRLVGATGWRPD